MFKNILFSMMFLVSSLLANTLGLEDNGDGTIDVLYNSDADIGGFQFTVEGATVTGASGGDAEANGFMISCSATTCLGFSLTGNVIPAGNGTLVVVSVFDITGEVSLTGIVVSDAAGNALDFSYDSGPEAADYVVEVSNNVFTPDHLDISAGETVEWINMGGFHNVDGSTDTYPNNPDSFYNGTASSDLWSYSFTFTIAGNYDYECNPHAPNMAGTITVGSGGCTDDMACNYDAGADFDDGSCTYAEENYDCDGNCTVEVDCFSVCGGGAVVDDCGVCDGPGANVECWDGSMVCDATDCSDEPGDGTSLSFGAVSDGSLEVYLSNDTPVAGFQFNITGITITGASGGSAEEAGFMVSTSATTVIGFSLSGATIPVGEGVLVNVSFTGSGEACLDNAVLSDSGGNALDTELGGCVTIEDVCESGIYDCAGVCDGTAVEDCAGDCGGSAEVDECGDCNGDGADMCWDGSYECDAADCPDIPGGSVEVNYDSDTDIAGFQFNVEGVTILSAGGGAAEAAGFMISASSTTVIGFSLTGATIPAGSGVLVVLEVEGDTGAACLADLVISDANGTALEAEVDGCTTIVVGGDDCAEGYDECGVCGGDNSSCADCAGVPNGGAVVK